MRLEADAAPMMRAALLTLLLVPAAAAQVEYTFDVEAEVAPLPIEPDVGRATLTVDWVLRCDAGGESAPATGTGRIAWNMTAPGGLVVLGEHSEATQLPDCAATPEVSGTTAFTVQATQEAAGLVPLPIQVRGVLTTSAPANAQAEGSTEAEVEVAYQGRLVVQMPSALQSGEPGTTSTFDMRVENFGNAPTRVLMSTQDPGFSLPPPPSLDAGEVVSLEIHYTHPDKAGWDNSEVTGAVTLTPVADEDASLQGDPVTVNVLARTRSTPAPGVAFVVAALALAVRRH